MGFISRYGEGISALPCFNIVHQMLCCFVKFIIFYCIYLLYWFNHLQQRWEVDMGKTIQYDVPVSNRDSWFQLCLR